MNATYVNHNDGTVYATKEEAMTDYRKGIQIDLYSWSDVYQEWIMRGYWEV